MRKQWVAGSAIGMVIAGFAAAAVAAPTGGRASDHSRRRPPRPRVTTLSVTRSAELISYCWTYSIPSGHVGECADGEPRPPAQTLDWRPGTAISIDLRLPASGVQVSTARIHRSGSYDHTVALRAHQDDPQGQTWSVRIPHSARRSNVMFVSARFAQGDMLAEVGIHRQK
jgi:hypothetical protein